MTEARPVRIARIVQHLLPVVLLLAAFLELSAVTAGSFDQLDVGGAASIRGPSSFLPLSLAVLWAAFLTPSRLALSIKAISAAGAVGFMVMRLALTFAWWPGWAGAGEAGWTTLGSGLAGLLLGFALLSWSVVDVAATRAALAQSPTHAVGTSGSRLPDNPPVPSSSLSAPAQARFPVQARPQVVPSAHGMPTPPAPQPMWQSASTPWPRDDEGDPDGTLIRPPGRQRPRGRTSPSTIHVAGSP